MRKARQWVEDNPSRRKTFGGMVRFLGNWLSRTQNRGGGDTEYDRKEKYVKRTAQAAEDTAKLIADSKAAKATWQGEEMPSLAEATKKIAGKKP